MTFYDNLEESGIRKDTKYASTGDLTALLKQKKILKKELQTLTGLSTGTITNVCRGNHVDRATAQKIADALGMKLGLIFEPVGEDRRLSGSSILRYHRMLSSMFSTAVKWQMIPFNPAERIDPPKAETKEARYLTADEAALMLNLLASEPILYRTAITVLLYSGLRRGELLGLEWSDIDFDSGITRICRTSTYLPDRGIFVDETKNHSSSRFIKLPGPALASLRKWKAFQSESRLKAGDLWNESDRIFTRWDGLPVHPSSISQWFHGFVDRSGLPPVSIHSLRHTNATLLIAGNVNIRTVSAHLGHAQTSTTMNIYAHAVQEAEIKAAEVLEISLSKRNII
jgi:integrase